jgi:PHD-zinc-finger like domain
MIQHKRRCYVCGQKKGLKMHCDKDDCSCNINGELEKLVVHVTCARQAGLEVRVDDERMNDKGGPLPYGMYFTHTDHL